MSETNETTLMQEVAEILKNAKLGIDAAETAIHRDFVHRLVALASKNINHRFRSKIDPEEIVQSVFASFFRRHRKGEFECDDWNDLWALLVKITVRKCANKINGFLTAKRDIRLEFSHGESWSAASFFGAGKQPTPDEIAVFNESMDQLLDDLPENLRQILGMRLNGMTNFEISEMMQCSMRTVSRGLKTIKETLIRLDISESQK